MMPKHLSARHAEIAEILLTDWDPIGIQAEPGAQDEYDAYIRQIDALIQMSASPEAIADRLMQISGELMGLSASRDKALRAAGKLATLRYA
jgi:hypothetical protein